MDLSHMVRDMQEGGAMSYREAVALGFVGAYISRGPRLNEGVMRPVPGLRGAYYLRLLRAAGILSPIGR